MKTIRQILGERLTTLRRAAQLSVPELAAKIKKSRAWIYDVERGAKNFTADEYERLVKGCGWSADAVFAGPEESDIPHDLRWMLTTIVKSKDPTLLDGIRLNLIAISRLALSLEKEPLNFEGRPRQPSPKSGPEQEAQRAARSRGSVPDSRSPKKRAG